MTAPHLDPEALERAARAVMLEDGCGATVNGERVFCDNRDIDGSVRHDWCHCKNVARATITAYLGEHSVVVPREPTDAMATHPMATCYNSGPYGDKEVRRIYRAMIAAASPLADKGADRG